MKNEIRNEEETFKFITTIDLIKKNSEKSLDRDNLSCDCNLCHKRKNNFIKKQDSYNQNYRED